MDRLALQGHVTTVLDKHGHAPCRPWILTHTRQKQFFIKNVHTMGQSVFIFGKPPSLPSQIQLPNLIWQGKFHLSHWNLLVTPRSQEEVLKILAEPNYADQTVEFGVLYELAIGGGNVISVKSRPVSGRTLRKQLNAYIFDYIGTTEMTFLQVINEGTFATCIVANFIGWKITAMENAEQYDQIDNNCQEFIVNLIDRISPGSHCPRTLRSFIRAVTHNRTLDHDSSSESEMCESLFSAMSSTHRLVSDGGEENTVLSFQSSR